MKESRRSVVPPDIAQMRKTITTANRFFVELGDGGWFSGAFRVEPSVYDRWEKYLETNPVEELYAVAASVLEAIEKREKHELIEKRGEKAIGVIKNIEDMRAFAFRLEQTHDQAEMLNKFEVDAVKSLRKHGPRHTRMKVVLEKNLKADGGKMAPRSAHKLKLSPYEIRVVASIRFFGIKHTQDFILRKKLMLADEADGVCWSKPTPPAFSQALETEDSSVSQEKHYRDQFLNDFFIDHWFSSEKFSLSWLGAESLYELMKILRMEDDDNTVSSSPKYTKMELGIQRVRKRVERLGLRRLPPTACIFEGDGKTITTVRSEIVCGHNIAVVF